MTYINYNENIPDGPNNPSNDQPLMRENTNAISQYVEVDHVGFNQDKSGYHNLMHFQKQDSEPAAIANFLQLYTYNYTPDSTVTQTEPQLYALSGLGKKSLLTGFLTGSADEADGWAWVGGILIQWGKVSKTISTSKDSGTVTFKDRVSGAIPFPNYCFAVMTTPISKSTEPNSQMSVAIQRTELTKTQFKWFAYTNSGDYRGFFWVAIGN